MAIFNFGSINIDNFYYLPHLPHPGETLSATRYVRQLGGKGANQSVAAGRAGRAVTHVGAVGEDGAWCRDALKDAGIDIRHVTTSHKTTGHANIYVDSAGENQIVIVPGANRAIGKGILRTALDEARAGDILLLQNETDHVQAAAELARDKGMRIFYSAAPFDPAAVQAVLPFCDLLVLNAVEAAQLSDALNVAVGDIDVPEVLITRGAKGATWRDQKRGSERHAPAFRVTPVDTTGAGDCFIGNFAAALDHGQDIDAALRRASAAAAIQVTRHGTSSAMPWAGEVDDFLSERV